MGYDPDWKEKKEVLEQQKKEKQLRVEQEREILEERLAIQEDSPPPQLKPAREIPAVAREFLNRIKGEEYKKP